MDNKVSLNGAMVRIRIRAFAFGNGQAIADLAQESSKEHWCCPNDIYLTSLSQ